mgnify:CR=1 FL=1
MDPHRWEWLVRRLGDDARQKVAGYYAALPAPRRASAASQNCVGARLYVPQEELAGSALPHYLFATTVFGKALPLPSLTSALTTDNDEYEMVFVAAPVAAFESPKQAAHGDQPALLVEEAGHHQRRAGQVIDKGARGAELAAAASRLVPDYRQC